MVLEVLAPAIISPVTEHSLQWEERKMTSLYENVVTHVAYGC